MSSSKLNPDDVYEIKRLLWERKLTQQKIAEMYNVTRSCIGHIKLKTAWKHI